jgi:TonB-linked SusC/RagA family outer membrane protein
MIAAWPKYILLIILVLFCEYSVFGQERTISGIVTSDQDGLPIPGVTVVVPGTTIGTITDLDGHYALSIPSGADSLEYRFVGMQSRRIYIGEQETIDIILHSELYTVDEVVVTALGISRESKSLGYSVTAINNEELTEGNNRSALNALQGKVAGVNITSASGAPGASTRILVRGVSSLTGSNQPLFIIDGIPVTNSQSGSSSINGGTDFGNKINDLNPEDIESVSILKGASGTALYGSSAANGVIIITTKRGSKSSSSQFTFNSSFSVEQPLRLVKYQNDYGQGINGDVVLYENMSWGPAFDNRFRPWGHEVDGTLRVKAYRALPENVKEFFEPGYAFNNSLAFSGGNEQTTYYFSYSNIHWDGIFPTDADSYDKHTLALRSSHEFPKHFKISSSFNYIKKINSFVPTGQGEQSVYNQVMQTPRDISLRELSNLDIPYNSIDNHYSLYTVNPYQILQHNGNNNNEDRMFGSMDMDYTFVDNLVLKWRFGGDVSNEQRKIWRSKVEPKGNNEFSSVFDPGLVSEGSIYQMQINSDLLLTWNKEFENWTMNFLAGNSLNQRSSRGVSASVQFLSIDNHFNLSNSVENPTAGEATSLRRMVSIFGSADFSFKNMLFFAVSARNEWSSTLPVNHNSFFFPGVNAGFIFTELLPSINAVFSYGKIRASWARVGNDAPPYMVKSVFQKGFHSDGYGYFAYPLVNGVNSYDVGDLMANENLMPELTDEYEIGGDFRFFANRISADIAWYHKSTTNLIWPSPVPYSSGYRNQMQNLGKITNKGFELLIRIVPVRTEKLEWELSANFTRNYNELNYLNNQLQEAELNALRVDGGQQVSWLAIPGMPIGVFKARGPKYTSEGQMIVDNQGLPVAADELMIYGNSQYKYFGGISSRLTVDNFTFSMRFDVRQGGIMYSRTRNISMWAGTTPETLYNDREPFIIPNSVVETGTDEQGEPIYTENSKPVDRYYLVSYWGNGGMELDGSSFIDKSFVKLREVVLSYNFPSRYFENMPISTMNISLVGRNLWLWTPAGQTFIDPELTTFGNDLLADFGEYGAQPSTRSVSINLRVVF